MGKMQREENTMATNATVRGRFCPQPQRENAPGESVCRPAGLAGCAAPGGELLLRMEDLDPDRCRPEYLSQLADDLIWLGLDWDLGWRPGETAYCQSCRTPFYQAAFKTLASRGLVYPCYCSRKERLAASAPTPPTAPEFIPAGAAASRPKKKPPSKRAAVLPPGASRCRERSFPLWMRCLAPSRRGWTGTAGTLFSGGPMGFTPISWRWRRTTDGWG